MPSKAMSSEELAALKARLADMAARMRTVETIIDGQPERFSIFFKMNFKTNGGRMMDVAVRVLLWDSKLSYQKAVDPGTQDASYSNSEYHSQRQQRCVA